MQNKHSLVSIVIPSYNKSDLLIEMIESIINQTYPFWELIIVDDGSDNENFQKVHSFIGTDKRITHIRRNREPKNGDTCRNIGMEMARGKYIIIFDSDDLISPKCLEKRVEYMETHSEYDYASFPYAVFNDGDSQSLESPKKYFKEVAENNILTFFLKGDYPFTVWSNIYKRESIQNIKWDENIYVYQDFDFMVTSALAGLRHGYCNSAIDYYYRQFSDGSNVCGNFVSKQKCDSTLYLFNKTLCQLEKRDDSNVRKRQFSYFIMLQIERLMTKNQKDEADRLVSMLSKHYSSFFIYRLKLSYAIASHFDNFGIRRNVLFSLYIILFQNSNYIKRIFEHFSR